MTTPKSWKTYLAMAALALIGANKIWKWVPLDNETENGLILWVAAFGGAGMRHGIQKAQEGKTQ